MYPSVPGFDVPLGKGGCTQKCSVIRSCQVPCCLKRGSCNCFLCHSTGFSNDGTSVCALSKQTNKHVANFFGIAGPELRNETRRTVHNFVRDLVMIEGAFSCQTYASRTSKLNRAKSDPNQPRTRSAVAWSYGKSAFVLSASTS